MPGSTSAPSARWGRRASSAPQKICSVFLSLALTVGLVPSLAFADDASSTGSAAPASQVAGAEQAADVSQLQEDNGESAASDSGSPDKSDQQQAGRQEQGDAAQVGETAQDGAAADAESAAVDPSSNAAAAPANTLKAQAESVAAGDGSARSDDASSKLGEGAFVLIQSKKDQDSTYSYASGPVAAGTKLWANMYVSSGYYGADVVPADDGWTYQWLASDEKSSSKDDYQPIEGADGQSLTVTDDLAGKYLAVRVTVDDADYYGPRLNSTSSSMDFNVNYLPGPVLKQCQAKLNKVKLSSDAPAVGDTLSATAYTDFSTPAGDDVDVKFTWQQGDSRYGDFQDIEGAGDGDSFTLTEDQQGKYIRVVASAGVNEESATTSETVMAAGAVRLSGVKVSAPDSLQMPVKLQAQAYTGTSYSPDYVTDGVTYTWKYTLEDPTSYSPDDEWTTIEGQTGPTLTIDGEKYAGAYFSVEAYAGANTVKLSDYSAVGPVKLAGQVDIQAVSIVNAEGTSVFRVGDTATARVREKGAPSGQFVNASSLNFEWQQGDSADGPWTDIEGATSESLDIDASLEGKYLNCVVSSKVGSSTYERSTTKPVGAKDAINVTTVALSKTGKVNVGDTLSATASAAEGNVTDDEHLTWSWYRADSRYGDMVKIEGATGTTLEVTEDLLGDYIEARADGGFGQVSSSAAGPVVQPGAVELYRVEATGDAKIGSTVRAIAYKESYSTQVDAADAVSYQWQYAESNTTSDSAFADIPGATSAEFTVPETIDGRDAAGLYLRVKATSDGSVVSTYQKSYSSYYPATYVDPLGPITLAGQYTLTRVKLSSSGQGMQAGNAITPTAMVEGSYYGDDPAPADAKLTFTWCVSDAADGAFEPIEAGYDPADGVLTLSPDLAGKFVKVKACALDNTVESAVYQVLPEGAYDLLRVTTSPAINGSATLLTGAEVQATAYAKKFDSTTTGDDVTEGVSFQWMVGEDPEGAFEPLEGATSVQLTIPAQTAGKYLKVVATSGASSVEQVSAAPVVDGDSVEGAVAKLENESWRPQPVYGTDANLNDVMEAKLADMGASDVQVRVKTVAFQTESDAVEVGVSAADDATNGQITYANYLPENVSGWVASLTMPRSASITFVLSRDGEDAVEFTPSTRTVIPWDEEACANTLRQAAQSLAVGYASGDSAASVTQDVTLPHSIEAVDWKTTVSWESSSSAISIEGYSWDDQSTGEVTRASADQNVTLTATVGFGGSDVPASKVEVPFAVTVKADPEAIQSAKVELQSKVDTAFSADNLTYIEDQSAVDADSVTGDVQLPRPSALGIDGAAYAVSYTASKDAVQVNGYRANAYHPLPGGASESVDLTMTVTSKENPEITASKTITLKIAPLDADDIRREANLMEQAKEGYAAALLNGQDASAVTDTLSTFQKAYFDADGNLAWARDSSSASAAGDGIVKDDLHPADDMGAKPGHWYESSDPSVVSNDSLVLTQPDYTTDVTITSCLTSEKYARYAQRYADDPEWGSIFASLSRQTVSATFSVKGALGDEDPNPQVSVTAAIIGVDGNGADQWWAAATPFTFEPGATAEDATLALFEQAGIDAYYTYSDYGFYLQTITSPYDDDLTLGYDPATGKFWQLFVNGEPASTGAGSIELEDGDAVTWYFSASSTLPEEGMIAVSAQVIGRNAEGESQTWAMPAQLMVPQGATAADLSDLLFEQAGIKADTSESDGSWFLNSLTSPFDDSVVLSSEQVSDGVWAYWQLFINGEFADTLASGYTLQPGDEISWVYGSDGTIPGQVKASLEVIGATASGESQRWLGQMPATLVEGATAADLTEAVLSQSGIAADIYTPESQGYWMLNTVTSPYDENVTLGYDPETGAFWQLFINGECATVGADGYTLKPGDTISWVYGSDGTMPGAGDVVVDPNAQRPDWSAEWPGFADGGSGSATTQAPTPTEGSQTRWQSQMKDPSDWATYVSDPIIVNGRVYVAVGSELRVLDAQTGELLQSAALVAPINSIARMVYADGLIVVPLSEGRLQALTADKLITTWVTEGFAPVGSTGSQQSITSLYVHDGCVYYGTTASTFGGQSLSGYFACVDLDDGSLVWSSQRSDTGYYWSGAASVNGWIVVADDGGTLNVMRADDGKIAGRLDLADSVRTNVVAGTEEGTVLVVSTDGVLHKVRIDAATGKATEVASVSFAASSTSTPTIVDGKVYVGGKARAGVSAVKGGGVLAVIDEATMALEREVVALDGGGSLPADVKSAPLVSQQSGQTYVYFTCNSTPGGIYSYHVGDVDAKTVFTPDADHQNYTMASIVCGADGTLYYINDSGALFAVAGAPSTTVTFVPNNGSASTTVYVALGGTVAAPADPERSGYSFGGWYADEALTQEWDFSTPITQALTLYAKWIENESGQTPPAAQGGNPPAAPAPSPAPTAPSAAPAAASALQAGSSGAASADGAGSAAKSGTVKAKAATMSADAEAQSAAANPLWWLPIAGIVVGACGVATAVALGVRAARRKDS